MYEKLDIKYNIFSEAFPPDEKGERHNLLSYSSYHNLINGIKINPEKIIYKPLSNSNFLEVKNLHKEWFPIDYDDDFFNQVLNNNGGKYFTVGAFYNINNENINKEIILGLAFCEFEYVMEQLNKWTKNPECNQVVEVEGASHIFYGMHDIYAEMVLNCVKNHFIKK